jgi:hypothetical protein
MNAVDKVVKLPVAWWDKASAVFATNAQGVATVVLHGAPRAQSTWLRVEAPILQARNIPVNVVTGGVK